MSLNGNVGMLIAKSVLNDITAKMLVNLNEQKVHFELSESDNQFKYKL